MKVITDHKISVKRYDTVEHWSGNETVAVCKCGWMGAVIHANPEDSLADAMEHLSRSPVRMSA